MLTLRISRHCLWRPRSDGLAASEPWIALLRDLRKLNLIKAGGESAGEVDLARRLRERERGLLSPKSPFRSHDCWVVSMVRLFSTNNSSEYEFEDLEEESIG